MDDTTTDTQGYSKFALRRQPTTSTNNFTWDFIVPTGNIQTYAMTASIRVKLNNSAYYGGTHTNPTLAVNYDNGTIATAVATNTTNWQTLTVTFTPTTQYGQISISLYGKTDATTTNAYFYLDNFALAFPAGYAVNLGALDVWASGLPITPSSDTTGTLSTVWTDDPYVVDSEATASAFTGIAINYTTKIIDVTETHTITQIYEYAKASARSAGVLLALSTKDGVAYTLSGGWVMHTDVDITSATQNLNGNFVYNTPATYTTKFGTATLDFITNGSYDFGTVLMVGTITLNTSNNSTVTITLDGTVSYVNSVPAHITVVQPVIAQGLNLTGLIAGSQVYIFTSGTQTVLDYTNNSGTSHLWQQTWTVDITVDYTIIKEGYLPQRTTGVLIQTSTITVPIQQLVDRAYVASSGLTWGTTATVTVATSVFTVSTRTTGQNWYSFMMESWRAQSTLKNVAFPLIANGPNSFTLISGWEFSSGSIQYLHQDGIRYMGVSGLKTSVYAAILSSGDVTGLQVRYQQTDGGTTVNALTTGIIDQLVHIYGDSTHGNYDKTGYLVCKVQADGYDEAVADVVSNYGTLEDQLYVIGLAPTLNGLATGDPSVTGVTITDHGASPVTWNGKQFSITIKDSAGTHTGTELMRWLRYNYGIGGAFQGKDGFDWHNLIQVNGTKFKTVRGIIYGDTGATLKGVRVVKNDGTSVHPDFDLYTADNGTTYAPPVVVNLTVANIIAGSRIQVYDTDTDTEMANEIVAGTTWTTTHSYISDVNIRVRLTYVDGSTTAYYWYTANTTITSTGFNINASQVENTIYESGLVDGSTVTECSVSGTTIRIYVDDPDNTTTAQRIYNWFQYYLFTEDGIRDQDGSYVTASDVTHYIFANTMKIINQDTSNPLNILGANITPVSGNATNVFDLTNGASIAINFNRVEGFQYSSVVNNYQDTLLALEV